MAKKKKQEEVLAEQIPLEVTESTAETTGNLAEAESVPVDQNKKKKEKKVSRKAKKEAKKKAEKEAQKEAEKEAQKEAQKEAEVAIEEKPKKAEKKTKEKVEEKVQKKTEEKAEKKTEEKKTKKKADKKAETATEEKAVETSKEESAVVEPAEKPKKETKKSSKKKTAKSEEKVEEKVEEPRASESEENPGEKPEENPEKETKKSSKKSSAKAGELLTKDLGRISDTDIELEEAFAGLENQLKELDKAIEEKPKKSRSKSKSSVEKSDSSEKGFIKEYTIQLGPNSEIISATEVVPEKDEKKKSKKQTKKTSDKAEEKAKSEIEENPDEIPVEELSTEKAEAKPQKETKKSSKKKTSKTEKKAEEKVEEKVEEKTEEKAEEKTEEKTEGKTEEKTEEKPKKKKKPSKKKKKEDEPSEEKKPEAMALPSTGKLQDIKGDDIEDFIEVVEAVDGKAEEVDEIIHKPADVHIKPLPLFLSWFVPVQGDSVWEIIRKGLVVICSVLLVVSMAVLINSTHKPEKKPDDKNALDGYADEFVINESSGSLPSGVLDKYHSLYNVNNDMVGWLTLPGTPIDMPVVQYVDNEFYETTDFNGNDLVGLVAYADSASPMRTLARQTVLYVASGENYGLINGIERYRTFADENKAKPYTLSFGTLYEDYDWEIIACIETMDRDTSLAELASQDFTRFTDYIINQTIYPRELVNLKSGDKTLVLSIPYADAATEDSGAEKYLLLVARLVADQEKD